jgi:hypothetical protein
MYKLEDNIKVDHTELFDHDVNSIEHLMAQHSVKTIIYSVK